MVALFPVVPGALKSAGVLGWHIRALFVCCLCRCVYLFVLLCLPLWVLKRNKRGRRIKRPKLFQSHEATRAVGAGDMPVLRNVGSCATRVQAAW